MVILLLGPHSTRSRTGAGRRERTQQDTEGGMHERIPSALLRMSRLFTLRGISPREGSPNKAASDAIGASAGGMSALCRCVTVFFLSGSSNTTFGKNTLFSHTVGNGN